ncbi:MAG: modA [Phenylobacterium sp.]|nr:modA [Phenylobacterium sp.]
MKALGWIAAALAVALIATPVQAAPVTVFAAASLKNALDEVGAQYARSGGQARFSYAGSSAIARQIEQGAPADVYVSADAEWMDYLAARKLIVNATAKASLSTLGVWDSVSGRLAQAENVRMALQYVARGESPLGIVYDTDAKVEPKVRIVGLFPAGTHPKIVYPAAVVAASKNPDAAKFMAFLSGPQAAAIFRKYGFTVLPRR